jgi:uncharacterized protein (DUF1684 family)
MAETAAAAASRANPLKLNPLQLKTLAILQALARVPNAAEPPDAEGRVALRYLPTRTATTSTSATPPSPPATPRA